MNNLMIRKKKKIIHRNFTFVNYQLLRIKYKTNICIATNKLNALLNYYFKFYKLKIYE